MGDVTGRARLIWGISSFEILTCVLLVGVLAGMFVDSARTFIPKFGQAELHILSASNRIYWSELWANDGSRNRVEEASVEYPVEGRYVTGTLEGRGEGAVHFALTHEAFALGVISLRPAISSSGSGAVIWVCGNAPAPAGFVVRDQNLTSLGNEALIFSCRERS